MDFLDQLVKRIRELELPIVTRAGVLNEHESAGVYAMPGGQVVHEYMDGMKEQQLNYEYAIKSKDVESASGQLWLVSNFLESLTELPSANDSYEFEEIKITSKPAQSEADEQGFYYWVLDFSAQLITNK